MRERNINHRDTEITEISMNGEEKEKALKELNEAIRKCREAGIELGVARMWNGKGKWCLCFGEEVGWDGLLLRGEDDQGE